MRQFPHPWALASAPIVAALASTINADDEDHSKVHATDIDLTPAERRIFDVLADGEPHAIPEILQRAQGKRVASSSLIPTHINRMRGKLAGVFSITCSNGYYSMKGNRT